MNNLISDLRILKFPKIEDPRGNLSIVEEKNHIPFKIQRAYWIYDIPGGELRNGHAFKIQHEVIICLTGSFTVKLIDNLNNEVEYTLDKPNQGIYIPNGIWREILRFSTNSVVLILSSEKYDKDDYFYDFEQFLNEKK